MKPFQMKRVAGFLPTARLVDNLKLLDVHVYDIYRQYISLQI